MNESHLNAFGIKNFKSFEGEHWFDLKNITFLIGKNSSGKSSFISSLRLSQFNLFNENYDVDLGLKESWLNDQKTHENVEFTYCLHTNISLLNNRFFYFNSFYPKIFIQSIDGTIFFRYMQNDPEVDNENIHQLSEITHLPDGNFYDIKTKKYIDEESFLQLYIDIQTKIKLRNKHLNNLFNYEIENISEKQLWEKEKKRLQNLNIKIVNLEEYSFPIFDDEEKLPLNEFEPIINLIEEIIISFETKSIDINNRLKRNFLFTSFNRKIFYEILNIIELEPLKELIDKIKIYDCCLRDEFSFNEYFSFLNIEKLYFEEELTPTFSPFKNISYSYISTKKNEENTFYNNVKNSINFEDSNFINRLNFVNRYLSIFEIGDQLEIRKIQNRGKIELLISVVKNETKKDLYSHFGFGVQILIPLLLEVLFDESKILLIEEPESNLHPALQSKLADFFVEIATKFNKQLVIETHSEYIIRRMQYLIANTHHGKNETLPKIKSENANIYYFNDPSKLEKQSDYTYEITFKNDGGLTKPFGPGFFDVTDDIAYELFMLKNKNFN